MNRSLRSGPSGVAPAGTRDSPYNVRMLIYLGYLALGLFAGAVGGFAGVGGGIIIIPALVLLFGFPQMRAQATSLAVLMPPIAILSFLQYWNNPEAKPNLWIAAVIALGALIGGLYGGRLANHLDPVLVRKCFAVLIACASVYLFFKK